MTKFIKAILTLLKIECQRHESCGDCPLCVGETNDGYECFFRGDAPCFWEVGE